MGRQLAPQLRVGRGRLPSCARPWLPPPTRRPIPCPRLASCPLPSPPDPHALRPDPAPRCATPPPYAQGGRVTRTRLTQGVSLVVHERHSSQRHALRRCRGPRPPEGRAFGAPARGLPRGALRVTAFGREFGRGRLGGSAAERACTPPPAKAVFE